MEHGARPIAAQSFFVTTTNRWPSSPSSVSTTKPPSVPPFRNSSNTAPTRAPWPNPLPAKEDTRHASRSERLPFELFSARRLCLYPADETTRFSQSLGPNEQFPAVGRACLRRLATASTSGRSSARALSAARASPAIPSTVKRSVRIIAGVYRLDFPWPRHTGCDESGPRRSNRTSLG